MIKTCKQNKTQGSTPFVSGTLQEVSERGYYIIKIQVIKLPVFNLLLCLKVKSPERHLTQSNIAIAVRSILSLLFTLTVIHFRMVNTSDCISCSITLGNETLGKMCFGCLDWLQLLMFVMIHYQLPLFAMETSPKY